MYDCIGFTESNNRIEKNKQSLFSTRSTVKDNRLKPKKKRFLFCQRLVQRWQECYSGCDLNNLFSTRQDLKELLKSHPTPEVCK